jgi:hypothetical protein
MDMSQARYNLDIIDMADLPSRRLSERLTSLCASLDLADPFRYLHSNSREATFNGRSRVDFFLMSKSMLRPDLTCTIQHNYDRSLFDHKAVKLYFSRR